LAESEYLEQIKEILNEVGKYNNVIKLIQENNFDGFKSALSSIGDNPNFRTVSGSTCLHEAIKVDSTQITEYILNLELNVNVQNIDGDTALHLAVKMTKFTSIKILRKRGANVFLENKKRQSSIDIAQENSNIGIEKELHEIQEIQIDSETYIETVKKRAKKKKLDDDLFQKMSSRMDELFKTQLQGIQQIHQQVNDIQKTSQETLTGVHNVHNTQKAIQNNLKNINSIISNDS